MGSDTGAPWLVVNPRSGDGKAGRVGLVEAARARGIRVHVLEAGDGEEPQLATGGPDRAGMLAWPSGVAGAVAGWRPGQVPQHRGGSAREAADQAVKVAYMPAGPGSGPRTLAARPRRVAPVSK